MLAEEARRASNEATDKTLREQKLEALALIKARASRGFTTADFEIVGPYGGDRTRIYNPLQEFLKEKGYNVIYRSPRDGLDIRW